MRVSQYFSMSFKKRRLVSSCCLLLLCGIVYDRVPLCSDVHLREDSRASLFQLLKRPKSQAHSASTIQWNDPSFPMPYMAIRDRKLVKRNVDASTALLKVS